MRCASPTRSRAGAGLSGRAICAVLDGRGRCGTRRRDLHRGWPRLAVREAATFAFTAEKRRTASLAIDHLARHAPVLQREIALPGRRRRSARSMSTRISARCASRAPARVRKPRSSTTRIRRARRSSSRIACSVACARRRALRARDLADAAPSLAAAGGEAARASSTRRSSSTAPRAASCSAARRCWPGTSSRSWPATSMFSWRPARSTALRMCADCRVIDLMEERARPRHPGCRGHPSPRHRARGPGARRLLSRAWRGFSAARPRRLLGGHRCCSPAASLPRTRAEVERGRDGVGCACAGERQSLTPTRLGEAYQACLQGRLQERGQPLLPRIVSGRSRGDLRSRRSARPWTNQAWRKKAERAELEDAPVA